MPKKKPHKRTEAVDPIWKQRQLAQEKENRKYKKAIRTKRTNVVFTAPGSFDLPATKFIYDWKDGKHQTIETVWQLTEEEQKKVAETGIVYLNVVASNPQPCLLSVDSLAEDREKSE